MKRLDEGLRGRTLRPFLLGLCILFGSGAGFAQKSQQISADSYKAQYFSESLAWQTLWVNKEQRAQIESILGRSFKPFRVRYWEEQGRSGWIFEEIGKELPITVGVIVEQGEIIDLTVLEFRESRGGEVVYPFFTGQFTSAKLEAGKSYGLDKNIDGITGATLSVRALKKIATLALYCDRQTRLLSE